MWWFWAGLAAVVVLAGLVPASMYLQAHGYTRRPAPSASPSPTATMSATHDPVPAGGVGDRVRDGDVEFTVTAVDCTRTELGQHAEVTAQGHFCVVSVQATNLGATSVSLPFALTARTANNIWVSTDYAAQTYVGGSLSSIQIRPSRTVSGSLVFDAPSHLALEEVLLRTQEGSGVIVRLV